MDKKLQQVISMLCQDEFSYCVLLRAISFRVVSCSGQTESSVQFSHSGESNSLQPHGLHHARLSCPSSTPGVYSNSRPLSQLCHPIIVSPLDTFSSHVQSFPASGSFPINQFFTSGSQSYWSFSFNISPSRTDLL